MRRLQKRFLLTFLTALLLTFSLSAASPEYGAGALFDFDGTGFVGGWKAGSNYGVSFDLKYSLLHTEVDLEYYGKNSTPMRLRTSIGLAFDLWRFRFSSDFGIDYVYTLTDKTMRCNGIAEGNPFNVPLSVVEEISFLSDNYNIGFRLSFATPYILSLNNVPDIYYVLQDRNLTLYYLKESSIGFFVKRRF